MYFRNFYQKKGVLTPATELDGKCKLSQKFANKNKNNQQHVFEFFCVLF